MKSRFLKKVVCKAFIYLSYHKNPMGGSYYSDFCCCCCSLSCVQLLANLWTARLLCPWDSPSRNTGVGCHFLLQPSFYMWGNQGFSSVHSLSRVQLFVTPWIAARQASLSITNSWSSLRLTPIESVMPSSHLILCHPLLFLPPIPPSIRVFSNESTLRMRWPKYWSFSFSIIPSKEIPGLISFRMG